MATQDNGQAAACWGRTTYTYRTTNGIMYDICPVIHDTVTDSSDDDTSGGVNHLQSA